MFYFVCFMIFSLLKKNSSELLSSLYHTLVRSRADLFVESCNIRIANEGLGSVMKLMNPEAFSDHYLKEKDFPCEQVKYGATSS